MSPASQLEVDVAIVGGGLVGASLAAALREGGRRVLLVEGVPFAAAGQPSFDARTTALGNASRRIFEGLALWPQLAPQAAAIRTIHVSEAGSFGCARLNAAEQGVDAFGYVIANRQLGAVLWAQLATSGAVTLRVPARVVGASVSADSVELQLQNETGGAERVRARLVVGADGAHSQIRSAAGIAADVEDYQQLAVVANVASDHPAEGTAYERFTAAGPLALLPLHDGRRAVIWACEPRRAATLLQLDERGYLEALQGEFGWRAGRFLAATPRGSYPLQLTRAAGQGFNLGLRDAAMLAEVIAAEHGDVGAAPLLQRFAAWRASDRSGVVRFTDSLVRLFGDRRPGISLLRNLGLLVFDLTPPAKSALARVSAGFAGPTPRLARGLPLKHV
jgi:2-octaprenyl-6-methoxyphenol hydroxylase